MSGGENAAVVARDKQIAWMVRNIEAMRDNPYPSDKRRKAQIMSRDLTLGAAARDAGLPLPRLSYWPRQTPKRKRRKR